MFKFLGNLIPEGASWKYFAKLVWALFKLFSPNLSSKIEAEVDEQQAVIDEIQDAELADFAKDAAAAVVDANVMTAFSSSPPSTPGFAVRVGREVYVEVKKDRPDDDYKGKKAVENNVVRETTMEEAMEILKGVR